MKSLMKSCLILEFRAHFPKIGNKDYYNCSPPRWSFPSSDYTHQDFPGSSPRPFPFFSDQKLLFLLSEESFQQTLSEDL